ncbi:MAG TPA: hypothetical protein VF006_25600 [Longimicrobium sp.]
MAYNLTINFWGLCLFVPDGDTLWVLLPQTGGDVENPPIPGHPAVLYVDPAYRQPDSPNTTGAEELLGDLKGMDLVIGGPGNPNATPLPVELANVGAVADLPIDPTLLESSPGGATLTARIQLGEGTWAIPTTSQTSQCYVFPEGTSPQPLWSTLQWTMTDLPSGPGQPGDRLNLDLTPFAGGPFIRHTLYPIDGTIEFSVWHTDPADLPGQPPVTSPPLGSPSSHFAAYYILFPGTPANQSVPVSAACPSQNPVGATDGSPDSGTHHLRPVPLGLVPYTCMGPAQATPG